MFPARTQETAPRIPSHGERIAAIEHPRPIHALVDCGCEILNLGIIEMLASGEHATEQKRGVDRGEFAVPYPLSGFHVYEVVEEAMFVGQLPLQETERLPHAVPVRRRLTVTARFPDAQARKSKAGRRNTGNAPPVVAVKQRAIPDLASCGTGFVPEEVERGTLDFVQQLIVRTAIRISLRLVKRSLPRRPCQRGKTRQSDQPQG